MKYFIITIDTEGDNLWQWDRNSKITTENTKYLPRFQTLCEKYGFKPVWLTNYEMINDLRFVDFIIDVENRKAGELGMHLHAWNTPPLYVLPVIQSGLPYLIEYPTDIMFKKVETITNLIQQMTGIRPTSHRAGRWSLDGRYVKILKEFGYTVDCSVTPNISWASSPGQTKVNGSDFLNFPELPYWLDSYNTLLEVPVSIRSTHTFVLPDNMSLMNIARSAILACRGYIQWLRPNGNNLKQMINFIDVIKDSDADYIMFMLHSSELMSGGSPTFKNEKDIESLYQTLDKVFAYIYQFFVGITLREYRKHK